MIHVIGAGSFAAEIAEFCRDAGLEVTALVDLDRDARPGVERHGLPVVPLGPPPAPEARAVIGTGRDRVGLAHTLAELGWPLVTVVHPAAHVSPSAVVGAGSVVAPGAILGAAAVIGSNSLVSRGALVGHHTHVGSCVTLNPGTNIAGNCVIADDVFVGIGATVSDHVRVAAGAVIAAGSLVLNDVDAGRRVQGIPAAPVAG